LKAQTLVEMPEQGEDSIEEIVAYEAAYDPIENKLMVVTLCNGEPITDIKYEMGETIVEIVKDGNGDAFVEFVDDLNKKFRYPLVRIED